MDVAEKIGAVTRSLRTDEVDGEAYHVQTLGRELRSDLADVWQALTTPERIARWFLPISGDLRPGGDYQLEGNASGTVEECAPPEAGATTATFLVTWGGPTSRLTVRLTSTGDDRTDLEMEHSARVADIPDQMWEQYGPYGTGLGWDAGLLGLALHIESPGTAMTPEEGQQWAASDEGRAFNRASAVSWTEADIANGTDPADARRRAGATAKLYNGESEA